LFSLIHHLLINSCFSQDLGWGWNAWYSKSLCILQNMAALTP
jgi:hypothetical protein